VLGINKRIRNKARRLFRRCISNGVLDEVRVRALVRSIYESRRRDSLALLSCVWRLVKFDRILRSAEVESAVSLPADLQFRVQSRIEDLYGKGVTTFFTQRPALLGGMRVKVGSDVYDGSVRARLEALERRL
jgi:F-type H+-transporting ATPase subunit delta